MRIPGFRGMPVRAVARGMWRQFNDDDVLTYAAALAFHGMLALFPLLLLLLAVVTFFDLPQLLERFLAWTGTMLPGESMDQIITVLEEVQEGRNAGLVSAGLLGAIWAASGGVRAAMKALNRAYDVQEPRAFWKRYPLSVAYTIALAFMILAATGLMLIGPAAVEWLAEPLGLDRTAVLVWAWLRYPVAIVLLVITTAIAYSVLPNIGRFRWITPGAVLTVMLWILLSLGFRLYIDNFGRYNVVYGSLGAVIVLLLYLWLSSIILLLGGELNGVIHRHGTTAPRAAGTPTRQARDGE
jgi:membrane protein